MQSLVIAAVVVVLLVQWRGVSIGAGALLLLYLWLLQTSFKIMINKTMVNAGDGERSAMARRRVGYRVAIAVVAIVAVFVASGMEQSGVVSSRTAGFTGAMVVLLGMYCIAWRL